MVFLRIFDNKSLILDKVEKDLIEIMSAAVKSEIFIIESFFNILRAGSGLKSHNHINDFDTNHNFIDKKYSLTYYLSVGDQKCAEPGILKLYDPDHEILPSDGTIVIFPADRLHSSTYGGTKDRVMIGVNLQTSFLTPPMAMSAYYLKGVQSRNVELMQIFRGIMPFLGIVILAMVLMYIFPGIALWLPDTLFAE